ncbi:HAMP domain-containing histidine kinase [Alcaligenaceae bacterium SJ-26]|nr:HAMP domain-containing histidine kinase [Alcaligenaceae bacterium SJ-26]
MASSSIEKRIRNTVLAAVLVTFAVTATSVLVANENLERAILDLDLQSERESLLDNARPNEILVWNTDTLQAYYTPPGIAPDDKLQSIFQKLPFPYSGEIELGEQTYLINTSTVRGGHFYLARDISLFEYRESIFHRFLLLLGVGVILLGILLARLTGRRLAAPVHTLSDHIRGTAPAPHMPRLPESYPHATELEAIARAFNRFLGELEHYVRREQSLMGLASHELRTPIAVIAGALDVLEQRGGLESSARKPLLRMRRAVDEMTANIDVILKLTRRKSSSSERRSRIDLSLLLQEISDDLARHTDAAGRIILDARVQASVNADPTLVRMLLRNLIQNAVQHTDGSIQVRIDTHSVEIQDHGPGLPKGYLAYLNDPGADIGELTALSGLGLFIVSLICERLSWKLEVVPAREPGTTFRLTFVPGAQVPGNQQPGSV